MKKSLTPIILSGYLLLLTGCITGLTSKKIIAFHLMPSHSEKAIVKNYLDKYPEEDGVYLSYENHYQHVASYGDGWMKWKLTHVVGYSYVVLNPDEKHLTTFTLHLDPDEILLQATCTITSPVGEKKSFAIHELKKTTENKQTVYRLVYPEVEKGSVIEERFEIEKDHPGLFLEIPLRHSMPCERLQASITYPSWWTVKLKKIGPDGPPELETEHNAEAATITLSYTKNDVPAIQDEPFSPPAKWNTDYISLLIEKLDFGGMPHESPGTWDEFAHEFKEYVMDKDPIFSSRVRKTAKHLIEGKTQTKEQVEAIISYVQNVISSESSKPVKNFAKLIVEKQGNPYLNTALAQRLLAAVGIPSYYTLIHSAYDGYFDDDFYAFSEMKMPALWVEIEGKVYVCLPFIRHLSIDYIPKMFQDQPAIKISKDGFVKRVTIPSGDQSRNKTEEFYELSILETGIIQVTERKVFHGSDAYALRKALEETTQEEKDEILEGLLTYSDGEIGNQEQEFINLDDDQKPLVIKLNYTIDNLITVTPEEVIFQTGGLFSPVSDLKTKVKKKDRVNPIWIPYDRRVIKEIMIHYPDNWQIQSPPHNLVLENELGKIEGIYKWEKGKVEINQSVFLKKTLENKDKFSELMQLIGKKSSLNIPTLIFDIH